MLWWCYVQARVLPSRCRAFDMPDQFRSVRGQVSPAAHNCRLSRSTSGKPLALAAMMFHYPVTKITQGCDHPYGAALSKETILQTAQGKTRGEAARECKEFGYASLRIVWRNPRGRRNPRQWRVTKGLYPGTYLVQELVSEATGSWKSTLVLSVVGSLPPAAHPATLPKNPRLDFMAPMVSPRAAASRASGPRPLR